MSDRFYREAPHTHGGTDAPECTPYGTQCHPEPATIGTGALTEAERTLLANRCLGGASPSPLLTAAVERIVASREAAAATRARAEALREAARDARSSPSTRAGDLHPGEVWAAWLDGRADSLTPDTPVRTIPTTATVRAGLAATTAADNKVRWSRALKGVRDESPRRG